MPGLTLWLSPDGGDLDLTDRFRQAQAVMCHAPDYAATLGLDAAGSRVGHVAYPEYPVSYIRRPSYVVVVEGRVFDRAPSALEAELTQLAEVVLGDPEAGVAAMRRWILGNDGDYVIAIADAGGQKLVVLTDPLGRLPLYFHMHEAGVAVARECKFIATLARHGRIRQARMGPVPLDRVSARSPHDLRRDLARARRLLSAGRGGRRQSRDGDRGALHLQFRREG